MAGSLQFGSSFKYHNKAFEQRWMQPGGAGEGSELGPATASQDVTAAFPDFSMIPIMHPGKGAKIRISGEDPFGPPNHLLNWRPPIALKGHCFSHESSTLSCIECYQSIIRDGIRVVRECKLTNADGDLILTRRATIREMVRRGDICRYQHMISHH